MGGSVVYVLLFCSTLPSLYSSQAPHHGHHSRLDTNPDMELRPVRPLRRTTTQRSITVNDNFLLPEPPYRPMTDDDKADLLDPDYEYSYDYEHFHHSGTDPPFMGSGTIHAHDHDSSPLSTESVADYAEYVDHLDGHKDHFKNASTAVACTWYSVLLSLFLMKVVALI